MPVLKPALRTPKPPPAALTSSRRWLRFLSLSGSAPVTAAVPVAPPRATVSQAVIGV
jgi:hypothetical protein